MMPYWIAEIGNNHNGSLDRCLRIVDAAAEAGFSAAKLQLWRVDEQWRAGGIGEDRRRELRKFEVPTTWLPFVQAKCKSLGLDFVLSVCHTRLVEEAAKHADRLKAGSYELPHIELLQAMAATDLPLLISTGAGATEEEIDDADYATVRRATFLHCVSKYPCPPEAANLQRIEWLEELTGWAVGYSDHTVEPAVIHRAVHKWGAGVVEMHLDIDTFGPDVAIIGAERSVSWSDSGCVQSPRYVIDDITTALTADVTPTPADIDERNWRVDPADGMRPRREG